MNAAEENTVLSGTPGTPRHSYTALALHFFLLSALIALASGLGGPASASAKTLCTPPNRAGENSPAAVQLRPAQGTPTADLQRENSLGRYEIALDDTLAFKS